MVRPKAIWAGLIYRTQQHYHRHWLPNTEWSNSRRCVWATEGIWTENRKDGFYWHFCSLVQCYL